MLWRKEGWRLGAAVGRALLPNQGQGWKKTSAALCSVVRGAASYAASYSTSSSSACHETFGLTEMQVEFREVARSFALNELAPHSAKWDETKHFPVDTLKQAAELGFGGIYCQEEYGGTGLGREDAAVIFEALAYGDISFTAYLTIHNMNCFVLDTFGTQQQKEKYLQRMTCMELLSSYCLTEPNSGSDAASLETSAVKQEDGSYVLNGAKAFISGAGTSDVYIVMARTDPGADKAKGITCFVVEKDQEGVSFGKPEKKLGWNSQPTCVVSFDDVVVPAENRVGEEGEGFKIAMMGLDGGRINIATCSVGGAAFALDSAREYTSSRKQFGKPLDKFQNTQFKLADCATSLAASRLMVRRAARALDAKIASATAECAMAKRFATDSCFDIANTCLQLHGGYGYLMDYPAERIVRDLRVHSILEGTNEIMRVIIAREMDRQKV
ncbi:acyl-CoA dehydrogenase [Chloropicon primus]|uniref:Isobutyryl-CoA dehydrogenase, mitochondrial n=2 Tax=Chloropicon primus TaxID=1764295 RepID=A0A5B8MQF2_9CHLO|nr:acyl-CoA dehydrogenase [Chloropicon primus]|eukprot:QDZ21532.1 acyl-CoA dehydrogenase [Chloropicon primus]